jgi:hypothetical protein
MSLAFVTPAVSPGQAKNFSSSCAMFAAEALQRPHRAKVMELSRKEFRFAERSGSVAGVHHASSCAIWQSEKETILFVARDIEKQSNSIFPRPRSRFGPVIWKSASASSASWT